MPHRFKCSYYGLKRVPSGSWRYIKKIFGGVWDKGHVKIDDGLYIWQGVLLQRKHGL